MVKFVLLWHCNKLSTLAKYTRFKMGFKDFSLEFCDLLMILFEIFLYQEPTLACFSQRHVFCFQDWKWHFSVVFMAPALARMSTLDSSGKLTLAFLGCWLVQEKLQARIPNFIPENWTIRSLGVSAALKF